MIVGHPSNEFFPVLIIWCTRPPIIDIPLRHTPVASRGLRDALQQLGGRYVFSSP
jgi:hypothetical protein